MTPAIDLVKKKRIKHILHEYHHEAGSSRIGESYGLEAATKLGISADQVFKTLVVILDSKELAVAVIPASSKLSMKHIAKAAKAKKATMADKQDVERSTGYVLGGVSPLGQKKRLRTFIDSSAQDFETFFVSAGKRGLEIEMNSDDLSQLLSAQFTELKA
jgi:Cys-tRNA(Pro)/Cys-tRNA(Cys) deacylase|tara:strand:- start:201 stop:680 length:480 start_codon:yes stop_codon:yes gene_type:complete